MVFSYLYHDLLFRRCPQEHIIRTSHGTVSVAVFGDLGKPALITYPDVGLNCKLNTAYARAPILPPF